jgi:hypothetical protein
MKFASEIRANAAAIVYNANNHCDVEVMYDDLFEVDADGGPVIWGHVDAGGKAPLTQEDLDFGTPPCPRQRPTTYNHSFNM